MSNEVPEQDLNLDLHFLPSWAQESAEVNRYANYEGERENRRFNRGSGPRPGGRGPGHDRPRGPRPPGGDRQGRGGERSDRGDRNDRGPRGRAGGPRPGGGKFAGGPRHGGKPFQPRVELPPINLDINIVPDNRGVDSLTKQIRLTGRAYPLFDIARIVLQKDDRFTVEFKVKKGPDGKPLLPLLVCALDDTVWTDEEEAIGYVIDRHLATFYQVEKTPTDPPKGTYTFVAQCGFSGIILGPPNYHDYQNKLHRLHQERFANMDFERFRSRVKIVRDEEVVKKWIEEQSFKTEYVALNVPETLRLQSLEDVRQHFRAVHLATMLKSVEQHSLPGVKCRRVGSRELQRYVTHEVEDQRRFPLKTVTSLSQQFATRGLQFFKVNKNIVHVAVARPHFLDITSEPVSEGVKTIVNYVNEHPRCTVKELVETLAPAPAAPPIAVAPPTPAPAPAEGEPAAEAAPESPEAKPHHEPTPGQRAVLLDLHWLVHQGHVIEYANGELETAKKPLPKPQPAPKKKPEPRPPAPAAPAAVEAAPSSEAPAAEIPSTPVAEPPTDVVAPDAPAASAPAEPTASAEEKKEPEAGA